MGNLITRWYWGGDPDEKNEISGLTLRDIYKIQRSWTPIYANARGNGFLMFYRLFEADPQTKTFFKDFAHVPMDKLQSNVIFKAHIVNVMAALNTSIQNLNTPDLVRAGMQKLGDSHRRMHVEKKDFWLLKDILVNILKNDLKLSDDVIEAWGKYIDFIYEPILTRLSK